MPILNVDENIKKISESIAAATQEVLRMEGALRVFQGFKEGGLEEVDIPNVPEGAVPVDDRRRPFRKNRKLKKKSLKRIN